MFGAPPMLGRFLVDGESSPFMVMIGVADSTRCRYPPPCGRRARGGSSSSAGSEPTPARRRHASSGAGSRSTTTSAPSRCSRAARGAARARSPTPDRRVGEWRKPITVHAWGGACLGTRRRSTASSTTTARCTAIRASTSPTQRRCPRRRRPTVAHDRRLGPSRRRWDLAGTHRTPRRRAATIRPGRGIEPDGRVVRERQTDPQAESWTRYCATARRRLARELCDDLGLLPA